MRELSPSPKHVLGRGPGRKHGSTGRGRPQLCQPVVTSRLSSSYMVCFFSALTPLTCICDVNLSLTPTGQNEENGPCPSLSVTMWILNVERALQ